MTYKQLFDHAGKQLSAAGVPDAKLDAWYLFSECFHMERAHYLAEQDLECGNEERIHQFAHMLSKREAREPLQYILGTQEFMGLSFEVSPDVLIPRQDTEILVEQAMSLLRDVKQASVLDLCTGSGCILLSIATFLELASGIGIDISKEALAVAERNRKHLCDTGYSQCHRIQFMQSDLFTGLGKGMVFDMIVSNPPYITADEMKELMPEVGEYEPHLALYGGEDGLFFYRKIAAQAGCYLKNGGWLVLEIGCNQAEDVKELLSIYGYHRIKIIKDLAGLDRVMIGMTDRAGM